MNVGVLLRRVAEEKGGKEGIIFEDTRLNFSEFNSRVNKLANAVQNLGIKKGERAAIILLNSRQYMEIYFAMAKLGVILVTLNHRLVGDELQYILDDSTPKILFLGEEFFDTISSIRSSLSYIEHYVLLGNRRSIDMVDYETLLEKYSDSEPDVDVDVQDDQLIVYTSGTTGKPKGALIPHLNTIWTCIIQMLFIHDLNESDSTLVVAPLYHTGAQNNLIIPMFYVGGKIVIMKRVEPNKVVEMIEKEGITTALLLPTLLHMIFELPNLDDYNLKSLRYVITGGAPIPEVTIKKFYKRFGFHLCHGYGLTESTAFTAVLPTEYADQKIGSVGKALFPIEVKIVDSQGREVKAGEVGEIIQRGPTLMKEYWKNPQATEEVLKNGWLYTGDHGRYDEEGYIYIVGRKKDMIISGEENIYPAEIEQVLYSHPKIHEAAVIGVPDAKWGESVKAIVVCKTGEKLTEEEIISYAKEHLASYKKPKFVEFIDKLPRNPSGKLLKEILREKYGKQRI